MSKTKTDSIASTSTWEDLLGSRNWQGLLEADHLDHGLRELIFRCGDFAQSTYDAFINNRASPNRGNARYGAAAFFRDVVLRDAAPYEVVAFLYATSASQVFYKYFSCHLPAVECLGDTVSECNSNWIGFVAATTDEASKELGRREIYIAWRGTKRISEWSINVFCAFPASSLGPLLPAGEANGCAERVHAGWLSMYTSRNPRSSYARDSARAQLNAAVRGLIEERYRGEKISVVVTGHSLGGTLATLSAFDLVENGVVGRETPVAAIVFCCPKVGNEAFTKRLAALPNLKVLHVRNRGDLVPRLPTVFGRKFYVPAETRTLNVRSATSPCLKPSSQWEIAGRHNLEVTLHAVAGWQGKAGFDGEKAAKRRSLALVNKTSGFLRRKYGVPESWWAAKNGGMVFVDGEWALDPLQPPPMPSYAYGIGNNKIAPCSS